MKMSMSMSMSCTALLALALTGTTLADDGAGKVLDCMRSNVPSALRVQDIELTTSDRSGGERSLKGKLYGLREKDSAGNNRVRVMLRVNGPANLAGSAFLVRETANYAKEGMYVYLPSVRRVRRVSGELADGALLGSDFSYADFRQLQNVFDGYTASQEAPAQIEQRPVYVLSFKPEAKSGYSRVRAWVDQKTCVPLKLEFYENQQLRKQLSAPVSGLRQANNYWYPGEVEMQDLKSGTKSLLRAVVSTSPDKLSPAYFSPSMFYSVGG